MRGSVLQAGGHPSSFVTALLFLAEEEEEQPLGLERNGRGNLEGKRALRIKGRPRKGFLMTSEGSW